jgi:phenylalanine-4-hydroxylase
MPAFHFFDCLKRREFPTTVTIRPGGAEFSEWPDIFHDITGHVPMHTDPAFADALVRFGDCAHTAIEITAQAGDSTAKRRRLTNIVKALARFFWFTVETGLMKEPGGLKVYGSAMLSSSGEIERCLSDKVQKYPIQLEWVVNQGFEPNRFQPLLFWVQSFDHLYELVDQLEAWMREGRLDDVAPGDPQVTEQDLASFTEI